MQTTPDPGDAEISFETQYYLLPLRRPLFTFTSPPADNQLVAKLSPFLCAVSPPAKIVCCILLLENAKKMTLSPLRDPPPHKRISCLRKNVDIKLHF